MNNNERIVTTIEPHTGGTVRLSHNYPHRPSWKNSGVGRAMVEVTGNPKWPTLDLHCVELPEGNKGTKEVYVSIPIEALTQLLERVGYAVTKKAV